MDERVRDHLASVKSAKRRADAEVLIDLMRRATGQEPALSGTIIGFGDYHWRYESGREGDGPAASFAPRAAASTIYLPDGVGAHQDLLDRLGPHTTGVGCLYLKDLGRVDLAVLEEIVRRSYTTVTAGTFGHRARESG